MAKPKAKKTRTTKVGKRNGRNRDKGKEYERDVALFMRALGFKKAARSYGQSATGVESPDIVGTPFWIEAGKGRTVHPAAKLRQAEAARDACPNKSYSTLPALALTHAGGTAPHLVTMTRETFDWLLARSIFVLADGTRIDLD